MSLTRVSKATTTAAVAAIALTAGLTGLVVPGGFVPGEPAIASAADAADIPVWEGITYMNTTRMVNGFSHPAAVVYAGQETVLSPVVTNPLPEGYYITWNIAEGVDKQFGWTSSTTDNIVTVNVTETTPDGYFRAGVDFSVRNADREVVGRIPVNFYVVNPNYTAPTKPTTSEVKPTTSAPKPTTSAAEPTSTATSTSTATPTPEPKPTTSVAKPTTSAAKPTTSTPTPTSAVKPTTINSETKVPAATNPVDRPIGEIIGIVAGALAAAGAGLFGLYQWIHATGILYPLI